MKWLGFGITYKTVLSSKDRKNNQYDRLGFNLTNKQLMSLTTHGMLMTSPDYFLNSCHPPKFEIVKKNCARTTSTWLSKSKTLPYFDSSLSIHAHTFCAVHYKSHISIERIRIMSHFCCLCMAPLLYML